MTRDVYPGSAFFSIPYAGVKKAQHPGSGSTTLNVADEDSHESLRVLNAALKNTY
jgi:hypothetical protein